MRQISLFTVAAFALSSCGASADATSEQSGSGTADQNRLVSAQPIGPLTARIPALNATALGLEVGYANFDGVKEKLRDQFNLITDGENRFSGGQTLTADASNSNVDGLRDIYFIFDQNKVLSGVIMHMDKNPRSMANQLREKYNLISYEINDFLNYGDARFQKGKTFIDIESSHLSFDMKVIYLTKALSQTFEKITKDEELNNQREQSSNF